MSSRLCLSQELAVPSVGKLERLGEGVSGVCVLLLLRFPEDSDCDALIAFCGARSSTARPIQGTCETRHYVLVDRLAVRVKAPA